MVARGYRARGDRPRPYDPNIRATPCEACGATLLLGDSTSTVTCDACGKEQRIPKVSALVLEKGAPTDETKRLAHLRTQVDHQWLLPSSVARFGNVLASEVPEARTVWVELRDRLRQEYDEENALALLCLASEIHAALPRQTEDEQLARRAIAEASAEVLQGSSFRHKMLTNLVVGATRSGAMDDARHWLGRFDPRSDELDADSTYRLSAALVATSERKFERVLELLGDAHDAVPLHQSSRGFSAVVQANALEKLGEHQKAVDVLDRCMSERHSALPLITKIARDLPEEWRTCEKSLPLALERRLDALSRHLPSLPRVLSTQVVLLGVALIVYVFASTGDASRVSFILGGGVLVVLGIVGWLLGRRRTQQIARGCGPVTGRILAVRPAGARHALDVVIEREGESEVRVTTLQTLNQRVLRSNVTGASFDGYWNPKFPEYLPHMSIKVSAEAQQNAERSS